MPRLKIGAVRRTAGNTQASLDQLSCDRAIGKLADGASALHLVVETSRPVDQFLIAEALSGGERDKLRFSHGQDANPQRS
jgi:hypothetical protein